MIIIITAIQHKHNTTFNNVNTKVLPIGVGVDCVEADTEDCVEPVVAVDTLVVTRGVVDSTTKSSTIEFFHYLHVTLKGLSHFIQQFLGVVGWGSSNSSVFHLRSLRGSFFIECAF